MLRIYRTLLTLSAWRTSLTRSLPLPCRMSTMPASRSQRSRHRSRNGPAKTQTNHASTSVTQPSAFSRNLTSSSSTSKFDDLVTSGGLSSRIRANIPFEDMTEVQAATIDPVLSGQDIFARAKTGTGKTFAFLIPSIQRLLSPPAGHTPVRPGKISILVVSPTRELAFQIGKEASQLIAGTELKVQCVVGGTKIGSEQRALNGRCDILVATPGRFLDHVENSGLKERLDEVRTLVLDEADRLLEDGFRQALMSIIESLPNRNSRPRQTLLFSATVSEQVKSIATIALLKNYSYISTVSETDQATHEHVKQEYAVIPDSDALPFLHQYLLKSVESGESKVIVFCTTANGARLVHETLNAVQPPLPMPVIQIHSRLSQSAREKATRQFRAAPSAVLVASDVIARGIDFTDVNAVVQIGQSMDSDQYIHRLGRTARAGQEGSGLLILAPYEASFLQLKDIGRQPLVQISVDGMDLSQSRQAVNSAMAQTSDESKSKAYQAWIGYNKGLLKRIKFSPAKLVETANLWAQNVLRWTGDPPSIPARTIGKMGLRGVPGLNIDRTPIISARSTKSAAVAF